MKEKTYQDFLNDCAKDLGFEDFAAMIRNRASNEYTIFFDLQKDAALRYANHVKAIAFEKACVAQKSECAKSYFNGNQNDSVFDSILNAPNADNPYKTENKYPIGGYAPGNYNNTCATCKGEFIGDKLARQCEPCAIKMTK